MPERIRSRAGFRETVRGIGAPPGPTMTVRGLNFCLTGLKPPDFIYICTMKKLTILLASATACLTLGAASPKPEASATLGAATPKPEIPAILDIAYSSLNDGFHINTMEHFKAAVKAGFNCLKADMQTTSDGVVVLCHDVGFTFDTDGRIGKFDKKNHTLICEMTYRDVKKLEYAFADPVSGKHPKVCTLDRFAAYCAKAKVWMYPTQRNDRMVDRTQAELRRILKKYGMTRRCIVNNYPYSLETGAKVHAYLPMVPVCYTLDYYDHFNKALLDRISGDLPAMVCLNRAWVDKIDSDTIRYAEDKGIRVLGWYPHTSQEYARWKDLGLTGAQITKIEVIR